MDSGPRRADPARHWHPRVKKNGLANGLGTARGACPRAGLLAPGPLTFRSLLPFETAGRRLGYSSAYVPWPRPGAVWWPRSVVLLLIRPTLLRPEVAMLADSPSEGWGRSPRWTQQPPALSDAEGLFEVYAVRVYSLTLRLLRREGAAEDVALAVLARAARQPGRGAAAPPRCPAATGPGSWPVEGMTGCPCAGVGKRPSTAARSRSSSRPGGARGWSCPPRAITWR
jgi:hypothetical protein